MAKKASPQYEIVEHKLKPPPRDPRAVRLSLDLNQDEFWGKLGLTQSAGSRYENGREMPGPTARLFNLTFVKKK